MFTCTGGRRTVKVSVLQRERPWLTMVVAVVLLINTLMLGRSFNLYRLPGEADAAATARAGAELVIDHLTRIAESDGLDKNRAMQDTLAVMLFEVNKARTADEVSQSLQRGILEAQTVMAREAENLRREAIVTLLRTQGPVKNLRGKATLTVSREEGREVLVKGPPDMVTPALLRELNGHRALARNFSLINIEIENGQVRAPLPRSLTDRLTSLEQEAATLRLELQALRTQAGHLPLTGAGVRIKVFDAFRGLDAAEIVHDGDVRDIVNELLAAGASGIAVGEQRLIATSSIRCAGPVILVNQRPIVVDPVLIEAVGDSAVLYSSLSLVRASLLTTRGVQVDVVPVRNMTLPAFLPSR